jgi:hypothetical protein
MQPSKPTLDQSLHLRISKQFEQHLTQIALANGLKTSSLARHILTKHLNDFNNQSLPVWMR